MGLGRKFCTVSSTWSTHYSLVSVLSPSPLARVGLGWREAVTQADPFSASLTPWPHLQGGWIFRPMKTRTRIKTARSSSM